MAAPRKEVDWEKVDSLCKMHCTALEIIEYLNATSDENLSYDTYDRRAHEDKGASFAEYVNKRHLAFARPKLRELQWKAASNGNVSMLIWLGKQYLDQKEPQHEDKSVSAGDKFVEAFSKLIDGLPQ